MRNLVIDTATPACSVALFEDGHLIAHDYAVIGRGHAERLLPMIAQLPNQGRAESVMVNIGPGSFTGIRVGLSAAKALALAWHADCHGYSNLQLLAAMGANTVAVDVAIQGGHGEYFLQGFDKDGDPITALQSLSPAKAAECSNAYVVIGDAADALVALRGTGKAIDLLPDAKYWTTISEKARMVASALYGRAPDAKLPTKVKKVD
jgi:tRNA threonylcarbamoyladenosine biosynthesis protein TsaB